MYKILLVGFGGFLGAVSRFGLAHLIRQYFAHPFPLATFTVNFLGCLGIGLLFEIFKNHELFPTLALFIVVGFLGSFTTFSTFSFETVELARRQYLLLASANIIGSVVLCLSGVLVGEWIGRLLRV